MALIEKKEGQEAVSPTVEKEPGQESDPQPGDRRAKFFESLSKEKEKNLPYDQDPKWKAARAAEKQLNEFMQEFDFTDVNEAKQAMKDWQKTHGKVKGLDLDKLLERDKLLSNYESFWAAEEEKKKRGNETPDQTESRLVARIKELESTLTQETGTKKAQEESQKAVKEYEGEVSQLVSKSNLPEGYRSMAQFILGINNPALDVDITDKGAIRKVALSGIERVEKFVNQVIKDYVDGKLKIPKIPEVDSTTGAPASEAKVKNLKEAKKLATQSLKGLFNR